MVEVLIRDYCEKHRIAIANPEDIENNSGERSVMIKTIKQACRFNPVIRDYRDESGKRELGGPLLKDEGDGRAFFSRNYVTHGMDQLFREEMLRLSGKSDQAVFELTQAMGDGKMHMMVALGLLARHPHLRPDSRERLRFS